MITSPIRIDIHTIRVKQKRTSKDDCNYLPLDNFLQSSDIFPLFQDFVNSLSKFHISKVAQKSIKFTDKINYHSKDRIISGIVDSGDYGIEEDITDQNGNKITTKSVEHVGVKPFYFLFWIPQKSNIGILITQRIGPFYVSGILKSHFKEFFQQRFSDMTLEFATYLSKETAKKFISAGGIREIILKRLSLPSDITDRLGLMLEDGETLESVELKFIAKRKVNLPINDRVTKFIDNPNNRLFTVDELDRIGFDGSHRSLVKIKLGRSQRTIDLSETGQIKPFFDIDETINRHPSGHPVFESINEVVMGVVADLKEEMFGV